MTAWPSSIRAINDLPQPEKVAIYRTLLPDWLVTDYGLDPATLTVNGEQVVHFRFPPGSRAIEISVKRHPADGDPLLYFNAADTLTNQILVLLVVINDPDAPRFNIDVDAAGNSTHMGSVSRNIPAERAAMEAGLAPGQIRQGLRVFRGLVPVFETFVANIGHDLFLIEPFAYHNAIVFERYGFNYVQGRKAMHDIHTGFQPGGELHARLDGSTPFRRPDAWRTIRGRSWAIQDGILGHSFTGFQMYKRIGHHAEVNTFPDAEW